MFLSEMCAACSWREILSQIQTLEKVYLAVVT